MASSQQCAWSAAQGEMGTAKQTSKLEVCLADVQENEARHVHISVQPKLCKYNSTAWVDSFAPNVMLRLRAVPPPHNHYVHNY